MLPSYHACKELHRPLERLFISFSDVSGSDYHNSPRFAMDGFMSDASDSTYGAGVFCNTPTHSSLTDGNGYYVGKRWASLGYRKPVTIIPGAR